MIPFKMMSGIKEMIIAYILIIIFSIILVLLSEHIAKK